MKALAGGLVLRNLQTIAELKQAERFQKEVWGEDDPPDNSDILLAIQHEGGLVAGAFKEEKMLGFIFGFPTIQPEVQHSHRLAVHPDSRGLGLGAKLKWYQRDWCLQRGITHIRWTYDPLRCTNAGLNIARLGATAGIYHENYYGDMEGINAGVPSDRLVADWHLNAPEVESRSHATRTPPPTVKGCLPVAIPPDFAALLAHDPKQAMAERLRVRHTLKAAFAKGYRIVGYDPKVFTYLLAEQGHTPT